jgi:hypothetical protein
MEGLLPDLRGQLAGLLAGVIALGEFQRWYWTNYTAIEQRGSDEDIASRLEPPRRVHERLHRRLGTA